MENKAWSVILVLIAACTLVVYASEENKEEIIEQDPEKLEYAKNSMCGYCDYCKFCKLCDEDCPCEAGPKKPNCHMCKYCKYCTLCSALCDTVCQAGGFLDRASSALINSLPVGDKEEIDSDIHGVKDWIDAKKDEL